MPEVGGVPLQRVTDPASAPATRLASVNALHDLHQAPIGVLGPGDDQAVTPGSAVQNDRSCQAR